VNIGGSGSIQLAVSTSDVLGARACRKREEEEEGEAAIVGKGHHGLENLLRKRERVKLRVDLN
jgi:hypothetical protein